MTFPLHPLRARRPHRRIGGSHLAVLVAAHDDPSGVLSVLDAMALQTVVPRRVTVLTRPDAEEAIDAAVAHGARVITTADTAAAVDEALAQGEGDAPTFVLILTAETRMPAEFIATALREFARDDDLGVVSGKASVITGSATMFRTAALHDVAAARGLILPGHPGKVCHSAPATDGAELALAVQLCGWGSSAPSAAAMLPGRVTHRAGGDRAPARLRAAVLESLTPVPAGA
ncbi:hypothetical protein [Microbacterium wangruii]|uniref:hypothetical protein n=1 Tax=Microbacterium wangruii TaxID=3049073 RepID=UPI00256ED538|nr:hypothetical protein [Microbacterium sp. zg-Y1211]MDL5486355.1 hypothetical protein [Microbacterium sp. zg-Y1211]